MRRTLGLFALACLCALPVLAQTQTGSISGKVTSPDGDAIPGVTVQASGDVLPQARITTTTANGDYRFPLLPPGNYTLTFKLEGMATETRNLGVRLNSNAVIDVTMAPEAVQESIEVVGQSSLIDPTSPELKNSIDNKTISSLPIGQDYRDMQKLIPGVQITNDETRGPSAGGSGQDNVYLFDGVNVSLPLFGVLSAEPAAHDIDQISVIKGGAKAIDFNRSSGFTIDSISKSGTNTYHGEVSYQLQNAGMTSKQTNDTTHKYDKDQDWTVASIGGPIVRDRLFFYGSYYRPTVSYNNSSNVYGNVPDFDSTRNEYFGRLSWAPTDSILVHGSYRDSDHKEHNTSIGSFDAPSTSQGAESKLKIATVEGTWTTTTDQYLTFKYTDFKNETGGVPDNLLNIPLALDGSVKLNVNDLASQGFFEVPKLTGTNAGYDAFITPFINQYGYPSGGALLGGGNVGGYYQIDNDNFFRKDYQAAYNWFFGQNLTHDIHIGYQNYKDSEDLRRISNGWGMITAPDGASFQGTPYAFKTELYAQGIQAANGSQIPVIHSEFKSQNVEANDTMRWGNFTFNVGVLASEDKLYGQGLTEGGSNPSGLELCQSCKYLMHEVHFSDQIQPRLGAVWAYDGTNTLFANYATYNPAASSLPRAASWARNLSGSVVDAYWDANGNLIGSEQLASSSGKFFEADISPRMTEEYVLGTSRQLSSRWTTRFDVRYRYSFRFWEDTNNTARTFPDAPADIPHTLYVPNLSTLETGIGGSSYVIARLNNAYTKYYATTLESEYRGDKIYLNGSLVWSHYYGNFDQDATTTDNDQAIFIGSSNIADGPGRQVWNNKNGNLHGDRPIQFKLYGYYLLPWNANAGALVYYQSGQPWEAWDYHVYSFETGSTSSTIRYAEPAGSNRSPAHYQLDLNYTQNFGLPRGINLQLRGDLFNVFDKQTGYAYQPNVNTAGFGQPTLYFAPRSLRLQARVSF
jgi:hypothetical protein